MIIYFELPPATQTINETIPNNNFVDLKTGSVTALRLLCSSDQRRGHLLRGSRLPVRWRIGARPDFNLFLKNRTTSRGLTETKPSNTVICCGWDVFLLGQSGWENTKTSHARGVQFMDRAEPTTTPDGTKVGIN